jgi:hypothetical protein
VAARKPARSKDSAAGSRPAKNSQRKEKPGVGGFANNPFAKLKG